ncbi:MAG: family oxidoreductase [Chitinophagaceae bacterium]|nr:family oxidoreductase [Chitinophagaceae bacterium]
MHIDARNLDNNSLIEGDVCIVGAGAAGISMALEFINTNQQVILLEGGGFEPEAAMQELYAAKQTGQRYFPIKAIRLHYFGGTTNHWSGFCSVFDEIDFEKRDWVPHSGWPITRKDLDPFYERAHKIIELGPYEYDDAYWLKQQPSFKPLPVDKKVVWNKIWQFSPPTRFGLKYKDAIMNAKNIHLYTYANVTDIKANENVSAVQEVTIKNLAGKQHRVKAKVFVIACCAVQNARLLLASNQQNPKGLGNDNDLAGRFFMEHLEMKSAELWLAKADALKFYMWNWGTKVRAELAISRAKQNELKILNGTASFLPLDIGKNEPAWIDMYDENGKGDLSKFDEAEKKRDFSNKDIAYQLSTRIEQSPNPNSRVMLDTEKDALGVPRVHFHWELLPLEKISMRKIYETIGQEVGRASAGRVRLMEYLREEKDESWPAATGGGWHHMGTTRMGDDPKQSVTNANCKVHGIDNLYMAGSSNFVTAAAPNPTLTLVALTLRLADHIKRRI